MVLILSTRTTIEELKLLLNTKFGTGATDLTSECRALGGRLGFRLQWDANPALALELVETDAMPSSSLTVMEGTILTFIHRGQVWLHI